MFSLRVVKVLQVQESRSDNSKLAHGYELEPFSVFFAARLKQYRNDAENIEIQV